MKNRGTAPVESQLLGWPFALLRISLGVMFFRAGLGKIGKGSVWPEHLVDWVQSKLGMSFDFYRGFLENAVLPNHVLFAHLVSWGELILGVCLLLGIATRYAAAAGAFMVANFWFAKGTDFWSASNYDALIILVFLALSISSAGRVLGLDRHFAQRWPWLHL